MKKYDAFDFFSFLVLVLLFQLFGFCIGIQLDKNFVLTSTILDFIVAIGTMILAFGAIVGLRAYKNSNIHNEVLREYKSILSHDYLLDNQIELSISLYISTIYGKDIIDKIERVEDFEKNELFEVKHIDEILKKFKLLEDLNRSNTRLLRSSPIINSNIKVKKAWNEYYEYLKKINKSLNFCMSFKILEIAGLGTNYNVNQFSELKSYFKDGIKDLDNPNTLAFMDLEFSLNSVSMLREFYDIYMLEVSSFVSDI